MSVLLRSGLVLAGLTLLPGPLPAQLAGPTPPTEGRVRLRWYEQHMVMRDRSPYQDLEWKFIGPQIMSGRVTDLAVPPGSRYTFYVATASGGLWKTDNEGTTWTPIFDDAPSASVGDVTVAPSDPDQVWVGLGEANIFRSSMSGTGVYRSMDAGKSFDHRGLTDSHHIARIVIHPDDPDRVYVAASGHEWTDNDQRGIYRTTDGGLHWDRVLYVNDHTGAIDLVMAPGNPEVLYAAMWDRVRLKWSDPKPGPGSGIYKSTDGGTSWIELRDGLPPKTTTGRIGLAVAASDPEIVYALIDNHETRREAKEGELDSYGRPKQDVIEGAQVFRSDDAGASFRKVSKSTAGMERLFSTYGWVFGQIRVDPNDADTSYIMGVPLLKSTDGGETYAGVRFRGLHGDHHAMWIDPSDSNHIINGNDGGVNISYDGGKSWKNDESLPVVQFYNVAYDMAEPFHVYGSIQDNGSWMGPVNHRPGRDRGTDWESCPGGEASHHAVDPSDQNVLYSESFYGRIQRSTLSPRETRSITPKAGEGDEPLRGQWLAPFILSPHNPYVIYHGMQSVFRSVDRGETWERISPDLTHNDPDKKGDIPYQTITSISESPLKFGLVYAGTDDGRVWMTRDGGVAWDEIVRGLPYQKWVSRLVASRYDEATVYLAQNGKRDSDHAAYLWRSTDHGNTWQDITGNIPCGPINVIREDPDHAGVLYVGTDLGVYVSVDGASSWQVLGSGLPITFVHDLIIHPRDRTVVIATHGRGMWKLDAEDLEPDEVKARPDPEAKAEPEAEPEAEKPVGRRRFF